MSLSSNTGHSDMYVRPGSGSPTLTQVAGLTLGFFMVIGDKWDHICQAQP